MKFLSEEDSELEKTGSIWLSFCIIGFIAFGVSLVLLQSFTELASILAMSASFFTGIVMGYLLAQIRAVRLIVEFLFELIRF